MKLPSLEQCEKNELAEHEEWLAHSLKSWREELANYTPPDLSPRNRDLLMRLEEAFRKRTCPPRIDLLLGGVAEDDYRPPRVIERINATDPTPRNYWQAITPELLYACEDALAYVEPVAFCYLVPAYLRQCLQNPGLGNHTIFYYLCSSDLIWSKRRVEPLTAAEREIVTHIVNERRCEQLFSERLYDDGLLPWEYDCFLAEGRDPADKHTIAEFAEMLALAYAEETGFLNGES